MLVVEKYHLQRQIGWSEEAEVHLGDPDAVHGGSVAVKIRHGMGGPPRPDGNRDRFLQACGDQQAAVEAGCRQVAPIYETGYEGDNAYYVTRQYPRSLDSLIHGRVTLEVPALRHIVEGALQALEEIRERRGRAHGNLKPTNIFLDGKSVLASTVVLSDLARPNDQPTQGADCYALGAVLVQLVRAHVIRHFDWPIQPGPDWERLGPQADAWLAFCNVLMSPEMSAQADALAAARKAFKNMRRLADTVHGRGSRQSGRSPGGKGVLIAGGLALAAAATGLVLPPADSALGQRFRGIPVLAGLYRMIDAPLPPAPVAPGPGVVSVPSDPPAATPVLAGTPPPAAGMTPLPAAEASLPSPAESVPPAPAETPAVPPVAMPTPALVEGTPTSAPTVNPGEKWVGYTALLQQFQRVIDNPAVSEAPEGVNLPLSRFRENVGFLPISSELTVDAFLKQLPDKLEATGDQADLPASLWTKEGTTRQGDQPSITYQWGHSGYRMVFNRVTVPGGNAPAFYLGATTVPVQFGAVLAKMAEGDGKGPLSGAASVKGPVSWEYVRGNYLPRASWMALDNINAPFYKDAGRPSYDSPMNGLSAVEAVRFARAAGCLLPTLQQWDAVLASPAGRAWTAQWQTTAKVRSPQWAEFSRRMQSQHITGAKLPNDQCFGDRSDLNAVTQTSDQNLFFEPVGSRALGGFSQLIGNVGQYVVDDARSPTKYYFAGGSAEAAPAAFQALTSPPAVVAPFVSAADGGLRLAAPAKGGGGEKNPGFDKLRSAVAAELARVQQLR